MTISEALDRSIARAKRWEASQARDEAILLDLETSDLVTCAGRFGVSENFVLRLIKASGRK